MSCRLRLPHCRRGGYDRYSATTPKRRPTMVWLIRELKRFVKWVAIFLGASLLLVLGIFVFRNQIGGTINRLEQQVKEDAQRERKERDEAWQKWWDDHQTVDNGGKQPSNKGKPKEPPAPGWENGFKAGYMTGYSAAAGGAVKPSGAEVDALARGQATKENVPEGERTAWKMGFSTGWTFGWSKGK